MSASHPQGRRRPGASLGRSLILAAVLVPGLAAADEGQSKEWDWFIAPYLFASSVSTDLEAAPPAGGTTDFTDIISKIDMAMQLHLEGQGDRVGVFGDITYLSLSDSNERTNFDTDASVKLTMTELAVVWNVSPERFEGADLFFGVRHISADADFTIDPFDPAFPTANRGVDQSFTDFMLGARYNGTLSDRWGVSLRADAGWGDTSGDYNLSAMLRYKLGTGSVAFGYRYMDLQFEKDGQDVDIALHGPVIAYVYPF